MSTRWRRPSARFEAVTQRQHSLAEPAILIPFLAITLIWSATWIVIKDQLGAGAEAVPAAWSVTYRFMLAAAAMFALALVSGARLRIGGRGHAFALAIGLPQFVANFNLVYAAEQHVTSGIVAVVFALLEVPNALLARIFFGSRVSLQFLAGSAVAMVGVALLFWAELRVSSAATGQVLVGIGFTLVAVLAASVGNLLQLVETVKRLPVASLLAWAMGYGAFANGAIALVMHGAPVAEARIGYWVGLAYLGLIASALAFFFYYRIIRAIGPAKAAYSSVLVPIVAMLISTVWEDYRWTALAAAGGVLAVAGLLVALSGRRPAEPPPIAD
jgi:drug/metabolite transporter (DMT)-like permease